MNQQQRNRQTKRTARDPADADAPSMGGGGLLEQASQFAEVARQARDACEKGENAERELQRRRNRSGQ